MILKGEKWLTPITIIKFSRYEEKTHKKIQCKKILSLKKPIPLDCFCGTKSVKNQGDCDKTV